MPDVLTLKIGDRITPLTLSGRLFELGFEQNYHASRPGEFMRRGAVLDIWPCEYKTPLRVEYDSASLASLSEIDLNGRELARLESALIVSQKLQKTLAKKKIDLSFIVSLKPGDFVTHIDHGIGRFFGIESQKVDGTLREYFIIEYKDKDRLYVPVERADKIDKYIGMEHPKLHRLHGASWHTVAQKVKEDVAKTACELLALYAKRKTASSSAFEKNLSELEQDLKNSFAYQETEDQDRAIEEIYADLAKSAPMDRLVCGDVGFGKTEVAIRAAGKVVSNGYQVGLLAPTTVLAQQHFDTFSERFKKFSVRIALLSRFQSAAQTRNILEETACGGIDIVIGTHRLLSNDVRFRQLGLLVIDEEQKFGVIHKEKLKKAREGVHVLTLSATPIPRTLNMSLHGLRDISLIATPPLGRRAVETIISAHDSTLIVRALEAEIARSGQAYYLYNKVETITLKAREIQNLVPKARVGIAHGQLKETELIAVMHGFDTREIDILVCSTIIENGLDLPNVNTLIVENAPKFGLSQLHQIRGRIGRGERQAFAYFLYDRLPKQNNGTQQHAPTLKPKEQKRLSALISAKELGSGFSLAVRDMEIRGIGAVLGKNQHGSAGSIGLSLYLRMLKHAILEMKTGTPEPMEKDVRIDLSLEYGIGEEFEPYEHQRMKLYHDLAEIHEQNELAQTQREFLERAKNKNAQQESMQKLQNLFYILHLKLAAQKAGITAISITKKPSVEHFDASPADDPISRKRLTIKFDNESYTRNLPMLFAKNPNWIIGEMQIKMDMGHLGAEWKKEVVSIVEVFTVQTPKFCYTTDA
ncbi:MAG: Transcription-repair coupling factor [Parcubacteria group bacterium GW2011_GWA2_44_12]|nr:MAG: Transcription-repair coupling factor [Parcubacteria group bacterium GW2011_GWA2_44_12]